MGWRFSLRELLLLVAFTAAACTSLLNASVGWAIAIFGGTLLVGFVLSVIALAERGDRQAAALGAVLAMVAYGVIWTLQPKPEITSAVNGTFGDTDVLVDSGYLPTSKALYTLWDWMNGTYLQDGRTRRVIQRISPDYFSHSYTAGPSQIPPNWKGGTLFVTGLPIPEPFIAIGHCLWALMFAYLGGKLAVWIYHRRVARECDNAKAPSDDV